MSNSFIEAVTGGAVAGRIGGAVTKSTLVGWKNNITLSGADVFNTVVDTGDYRIWTSGIRFPTTKNLSTDPKMLDDYEEGSFAPTLSIGGVTVPIGVVTARYTKVGRLVTMFVQMTVGSVSSPSGSVRILNLPYVARGITEASLR